MADEIVKTIYNDACLLAEYLNKVYIDRMGSGGTKLVRTKSLDNEREVQFYNMDMAGLKASLDKAIDDCRASQGLPPLSRRFAMTAGARRTIPRFIR